jgi:hypothetical protein
MWGVVGAEVSQAGADPQDSHTAGGSAFGRAIQKGLEFGLRPPRLERPCVIPAFAEVLCGVRQD